MRKNSLQKDDRGASLLAVLILMVVISAIAVVITKITIVNIQMKEVERGTKKNFYSADAVMDDLRTGARQKAEAALETAYVDVLQNYTNISRDGKNAQDEFARIYMDGLEECFKNKSAAMMAAKRDTISGGNVVYRVASYDVDVVKNCILDTTEQACFVAALDPKYEIDYGAATFTLKGIQVIYKDAQDYETTITTDLVFTTPQMNFAGQKDAHPFMGYALIADDSIQINTQNVTVDGSAYAGAGGIQMKTAGSGVFNGKTILTRGDIVAANNSCLTVGNGNSSIWAENIMTTGDSAATLALNGNIYVADDLALNAKNSQVTLKGNYFGYNFQKNYGAGVTISNDADFSSAIMINGKDSSLDLQGLQQLLLAGRTFISRGTKDDRKSDIPMGESLAVRTNQLAYYVPARFVSVDSFDSSNVQFLTTSNNVAYDGIDEYAKTIHLTKTQLEAWLDQAHPIVPYYYTKGVNYYLNFKSNQAANEFYAAYYNANHDKAGRLAGTYASENALVIGADSKMMMTLSGNLMYRTKKDVLFEEKAVTIAPDNWKNGTGVYWDYCSKLAVQYKSLELSLKDSGQGVTTDQVRFVTTDASGNEIIDKTVDSLFDSMIDRGALQTEVGNHTNSGIYCPVMDTEKNASVYLISDQGSYKLPNTITRGIVVAAGNVVVQGNFEGLIVAKGQISFISNATVTSNKSLVTKLFEEDQSRKKPLFSHIFKECAATAGSSISGQLDLDSYISYDGWKKN